MRLGWTVTPQGKPKPIRKWIYGRTRKEVADQLTKLLRDRQQGINILPKRGDRLNNMRRHLLRVLAKAGLPSVRVHDLRHTAMSIMAAQGVPIEVIRQIVGHSSVRVTEDIYSHIFEGEQRDAAQRMDDFWRQGA